MVNGKSAAKADQNFASVQNYCMLCLTDHFNFPAGVIFLFRFASSTICNEYQDFHSHVEGTSAFNAATP